MAIEDDLHQPCHRSAAQKLVLPMDWKLAALANPYSSFCSNMATGHCRRLGLLLRKKRRSEQMSPDKSVSTAAKTPKDLCFFSLEIAI